MKYCIIGQHNLDEKSFNKKSNGDYYSSCRKHFIKNKKYVKKNSKIWCSKCHNNNPPSGWHLKKDGKCSAVCNHCANYTSEWKKRNPSYGKEFMKKNRHKYIERIKRYNIKYYEQNKERLNAYNRKYSKSWYQMVTRPRLQTPQGKYKTYFDSSKRTGRQFLMSMDEFMKFWQLPCFYCGDEILTIGLDRIDNEKGYNTQNCVSCCTLCNWMKRSFSKEIFLKQCIKISKKHAL